MPATRFPVPLFLMALGMLALLGAMGGGLSRLGWTLPPVAPSLAASHGPLMVSGFLGTLIGVERAVALGRPWAYAGPVLTGLGAAALIVGLPGIPAPLLMTLGSLGLLAVFVVVVGRQPALFTVTMAAAAAVWLAGNLLWLGGRPIHAVVPWWAGFLVLTIAGERLELSRFLNPAAGARAAFLGAAGLFLTGIVASAALLDLGVRVAGAGLIALALWLGCHDVARRTVRQAGVTRFMALCLLSGYVWLAASGLLALLLGGVGAGPRYDALLHALFLGFVFAMIFGHAPVIFPAVLGVPVAFRPAFYAPLVLLHVTLALRVAGDLAGWPPGREWGGLLNVLTLLFFLANTGYAVLRPPVLRAG